MKTPIFLNQAALSPVDRQPILLQCRLYSNGISETSQTWVTIKVVQ